MTSLFKDLRQNAHLSRRACADYLQVDLSTINRYDNEKSPAPFAVCELLRVIAGYLPSLALTRNFEGWHYGGEYLYTPEGNRYTDKDIKSLPFLYDQLREQRKKIRELEKQINELTPSPSPVDNSNVIQFSTRRASL